MVEPLRSLNSPQCNSNGSHVFETLRTVLDTDKLQYRDHYPTLFRRVLLFLTRTRLEPQSVVCS